MQISRSTRSKSTGSRKKSTGRTSRKSSSSSSKEVESTQAATGMSDTVETELRVEISSVKNSVETVSTQIEKFLLLFQQFVSQQNVTSGGQSETNRNCHIRWAEFSG